MPEQHDQPGTDGAPTTPPESFGLDILPTPMRDLFDIDPDPVIVIDERRRVVAANAAATSVYGRAEELTGKRGIGLFHADEHSYVEHAAADLTSGLRDSAILVVSTVTADGGRQWVRLRARTLPASAGLPAGYMMLDLDALPDRAGGAAASRWLERAAALREADRRRLTAAMHDFPVQSLGVAQLLLADLLGDAAETADPRLVEAQEYVELALRQVRDLGASMVMTSNPDLREGMRNAVQAIVDLTGLDIQTHADENVPPVLPAPLVSVAVRGINETLRNVAAHSASPTAEVLLHYSPVELKGTVRTGQVVGILTVEVVDHGVGIKPGDLERAEADNHFGLASLRWSVTAHGGTLKFEPTPDGGTTVCFDMTVIG